jgi:KipI family sensor histidine kinase inhibitor
MEEITLKYAGDQAILAEFEPEISREVNEKVRSLQYSLEQNPFPGMKEMVPAYRSLLIQYDPLLVTGSQVAEWIQDALSHLSKVHLPKAIITEIPVSYDKEFAMDIDKIAELEQKSVKEIIRIHSQSDYFVYMLGFSPGHPYTARFENPFSFRRRKTPRVRIPGGSIVVQLDLSDIIPFDQPCGWNIIGSTPVLACDYRKEHPFLLRAGQWIRHIPVEKEEYLDIKRQVLMGTYQCKSYEKEVFP